MSGGISVARFPFPNIVDHRQINYIVSNVHVTLVVITGTTILTSCLYVNSVTATYK